MHITNLIEASADVITITRLKAGDVYKRIDGGAIKFGIVQTIMHNGSEGAFSALEISPGYQSVNAVNKVFETGGESALFTCTPEEFAVHITEIRKTISDWVLNATRALVNAQETERKTEEILATVGRREVTAPETTEPRAFPGVARPAFES